MKLAIMQPYLFPYITYWQLIHAVDTFAIFDDVNYIKKGYINRNSILNIRGTQKFTLELKKASQNKLINEIETGSNQRKILKKIEFVYKKAPYYRTTFPLLEKIFLNAETNLAKYIGFSIEEVSRYLGMTTNFLYTSNIKQNTGLKLNGQDRIINIAKEINAACYINLPGGKDLYDKNAFQQENISLKFINSKPILYKQYNNEFIPNLSIIDILMFNDKEEIIDMLQNMSTI